METDDDSLEKLALELTKQVQHASGDAVAIKNMIWSSLCSTAMHSRREVAVAMRKFAPDLADQLVKRYDDSRLGEVFHALKKAKRGERSE